MTSSSTAATASGRTTSAAARRSRERACTMSMSAPRGGVWGLERGYCMMIGGDKEVVDRLDPIFAALAPGIGDIPRTRRRARAAIRASSRATSTPARVGAGHFVKMIHNGIEYGLMQAYAEGFDILKNANIEALPPEHRFDLDLADIAEVWRRGSVIPSWLLDLTASALAENHTLRQLFRPCRGFRRRPLDRQCGDRRGGAGRGADGGAVRALPLAQGPYLCGENPLRDARRFWRPQGAARSRTGAEAPMAGRSTTRRRSPTPAPSSSSASPATSTHRLVIPALYNLAASRSAAGKFCVVGVARKGMTSDELARRSDEGPAQIRHAPGRRRDRQAAARLRDRIEADPKEPASFDAMRDQLDRLEAARGTGGNRLFYLATPPGAFLPIAASSAAPAC